MSDEDAKSNFSRESEPAHELTIHELVMGYPEILIG
jgi:hypothetical protein